MPASNDKNGEGIEPAPFCLTKQPIAGHEEKPLALCNTCRALNLTVEKFLVSLGDEGQVNNDQSRQLGSLFDIRRKTFCPFCRLVVKAAARSPLPIPPNSSIEKQGPMCYVRWLIDGQQQDRTKNHKELEYLARTRRIHLYSEPKAFGDAYLVLLADDAPSPLFFGRIMPRDATDFPLLRQWSSLCERCHGLVCNEPLTPKLAEINGSRGLRLVDVEQLCVVSAPPGCRYLALSYLWGPNARSHFRATTENIDILGVPYSLAKAELSRTISDAIVLVTKLGERYLWVDSLCLIINSKVENSFEAIHVDAIYANACLTIIAGTGTDHNAGLPGVQSDSRIVQQEIEECGFNLRLMLTYLAEDYLRSSEWNKRGWTFQERLLSKRCLLFVNGRIYFQCRQTTFSEDIVGESKEAGWSLDSTGMPSRIFRGPPSLQYISAVQLYTQRKLTLESDILRAFEGVANVLERHMETSFLYGLPESMLDYALLWESTQQLRRRPNFPSWSWAGWVGEVQWNVPPPRTWIAWYKQYANGSIISIPQEILVANGGLTPAPLPSSANLIPRLPFPPALPLLHFRANTAYFCIDTHDTSTDFEPSQLQRSLSFPSQVPTTQTSTSLQFNHRLGLKGANGTWCGTILLNSNLTEPVQKVHEFIVLSSSPSVTAEEQARCEQVEDGEMELAGKPGAVYNVLMVEWKNSIAIRVGLGRICRNALSRSFEPGVTRKDILLG
ncbi:MAG: hypothetical protein M1812_004444 [Candelaria pacifica]|nr:MAG: hypothetical protein M1812_004444 [Candelaria pacifica]